MSWSSHDTDSITISSSTELLHVVRDFVEQRIRSLHFTDFEINGIILAVDEACSNLIRHAYTDDATQEIRITVVVDDRVVRIEIVDHAVPFDPSQASVPDMDTYFDEKRRGGLGILLMTRVMDSIEYTPRRNGNDYNKLVLTKRRIA